MSNQESQDSASEIGRLTAENQQLRALLLPPDPRTRGIVTMTSITALQRDERRVIKGDGRCRPMLPDRLIISPSGTPNGDADWIINDLKIDGQTVFQRESDTRVGLGLPADIFRGISLGGSRLEDFVRFGDCRQADVEITVIYIGENRDGCVFCAAIVGYSIDEPSAVSAA